MFCNNFLERLEQPQTIFHQDTISHSVPVNFHRDWASWVSLDCAQSLKFWPFVFHCSRFSTKFLPEIGGAGRGRGEDIRVQILGLILQYLPSLFLKKKNHNMVSMVIFFPDKEELIFLQIIL